MMVKNESFIMTPEPSLTVFLIQLSTILLYILWGVVCLWVYRFWRYMFYRIRDTQHSGSQGNYIFMHFFLKVGMMISYAMVIIVTPLLIVWTIFMAFGYNFWGWNI